MVLNVKHDYDVRSSPPTSTRSARRANAPASCRFKSAVLKLPHLDQTAQYRGDNNNKRKEEDNNEENEEEQAQAGIRRLKEKGLAFHEQAGGEKHHQKRKEKKGGQNQGEYQYETYDRCGQQIQQHSAQQASASSEVLEHSIRGCDQTVDRNEQVSAISGLAKQHGKLEKDYKRVCYASPI